MTLTASLIIVAVDLACMCAAVTAIARRIDVLAQVGSDQPEWLFA